jgi:hypothetical protein
MEILEQETRQRFGIHLTGLQMIAEDPRAGTASWNENEI